MHFLKQRVEFARTTAVGLLLSLRKSDACKSIDNYQLLRETKVN